MTRVFTSRPGKLSRPNELRRQYFPQRAERKRLGVISLIGRQLRVLYLQDARYEQGIFQQLPTAMHVCAEGSRAPEKIGFSLSGTRRFPQDGAFFAQTFLIWPPPKGANSFRGDEKIILMLAGEFLYLLPRYIKALASLSLLNIME